MSVSDAYAELAAVLSITKTAGNAAFTAKRFGDAIVEYNKGVTAWQAAVASTDGKVPTDADVCLTAAQLFGNRSAAHLETGDRAAALADADHAVRASPGWAKGHVRRGSALRSLGRAREAAEAFAAAAKLDASDRNLRKLQADAESAAAKADLRDPVACVSHFVAVFRALRPGNRLRLATLATLWNLMGVDLRWRVLLRFLAIIGGPSAVDASIAPEDAPVPHVSQFRREALTPLPMHNYADLVIPEPWVAFGTALAERGSSASGAGTLAGSPAAAAAGAGAGSSSSSTSASSSSLALASVDAHEDMVSLFDACWATCSGEEQGAIIADIRTFFAPPTSSSSSSSSSGSGSGGSGGAGKAAGAAGRWGKAKTKGLRKAAAADGSASAADAAAGGAGGADGDDDSDDDSSDEEEGEGSSSSSTAVVPRGGAPPDAAALQALLSQLGIGMPTRLGPSSSSADGAGSGASATSSAPVRLPPK